MTGPNPKTSALKVVFLCTCLVGIAAWPLAAQLSWSIIPSAQTSKLLENFLKTADLKIKPAAPIDVTPADGTMPEIARQEFDLDSDGTAIIETLKASCQAAGLEHPHSDQKIAEPDMICTGRWEGTQASIYTQLACHSGCVLAVEAHTISY